MASKDFGDNGRSKSKAKESEAAHGADAEFRGYINLNLTTEEKAGYEAWADAATVLAVLSDAVHAGVNVACKPDPKGGGFLASGTQRRESSVNAGLCFTARAQTPDVAFGRLAYIYAILQRSERWEDTQPMADPNRW